jgi:hypothetical protein
LKIDYFVSHDQTDLYIEIPFEVPENIERIDIEYHYEGEKINANKNGKDKNVFDFALVNPDGEHVGTRGNKIRKIYIAPDAAPDGFRRQLPKAGIWKIVLGAFIVKKKGVTVHFDIRFTERKFRWLRGDTHLHTTNSDGKHTYEGLCRRARKAGLDFAIITDHNNPTEGKNLPEIDGLTCIRGLEFSHYKGHMNMWGLAKPYSGTFAISSKEDFLVRNREAAANGAVQSICHPTCTMLPWKMGFDDVVFDTIEIWNGPMRKDNLSAIELWDGLLKSGKKLPMAGGSDYHQDYIVPYLLGHPTMLVYADANTPEAILKALKEGHSAVTHRPKATVFAIETAGGAKMGDSVLYKDGEEVVVFADKLKRGQTVKVYDKNGCYYSCKAKKTAPFKTHVPVRGKGYVRAEIRYKKNSFARLLHRIVIFFMIRKEAKERVPEFVYAATNPIYFD